MARITALLLLTIALVAGCGGGGTTNLPQAADLLRQSAQAMRGVTSAHLAIRSDPALTVVPVRNLQVDLVRSGDAKGNGEVMEFGQLLELQFVLTGDTLYLKGPTGGFQKEPASTITSVYDTSAVLDPQRGVSRLLATATNSQTEAREPVNGRDAYRVRATFDPQVVTTLVPGLSGPLSGAVWIDAANSQLLQVRFDVPTGSGGAFAPVFVTLSNLNAPVSITPPQ